MKRLLFILSCLMIVSLSYADTVYGRLEKLEGNCATVRVYSKNSTPQVVTLNLKDTKDKYLHQPLQAEGQGIFIYGTDALSQVDKDAASFIMNDFKYILTIAFSFLLLWLMPNIIFSAISVAVKAQIVAIIFAVLSTIIFAIFAMFEPQREIVDYGRVAQFEPWRCVIEDKNGNKQFHDLSGAVFSVYSYADGTWSNPTTEGGIMKSGNSYELYQSFGKDRKVLEATIQYVNEKTALQQRILKYISCVFWIVFLGVYAVGKYVIGFRNEPRKAKNREEKARNKVEKERLKAEKAYRERERKKQPEYYLECEELVVKFWNSFFESPEDTAILLARLKVALQNSGYLRWQEEFYDFIETRVHESTRPSKEQRQKANSEGFSEEFGDIRINFNGIFVTPAQYRILSQNEKARSLSPDELIVFCRKLAEKVPEFRDFLAGKVVRTTQMLTNANEAYELFKLTPATLTEASLKQAYRRLVQQYHPDKNKDPKAAEMFQKVQRYHTYLERELRYIAA